MRMRRAVIVSLWIASLGAGVAFAQEAPLPKPDGFVNDFAGVLTPGERDALLQITGELERTTSIELGIAVVDSVAPRDSKSYAVDLFNQWGIGKKGQDNGVLILLAMKERRVEIEVGYGLEGKITDARAGLLLDRYAVPEFREGRFGAGLVALANGVVKVVTGVEDAEMKAALVKLTGEMEAHEAQREAEEERERAARESETKWILFVTVGVPVIFVAAGVASRPWMLLTATAGTLLGGWLWWWIGALLGGLLGMVGGWYTPRKVWFGGGGGGGGGSGSGSRSSGSSSHSSSSSSSGGSRSSGFGGGRSGGGGAGRGF